MKKKVWVARDHHGYGTDNIDIYTLKPDTFHYGFCAGSRENKNGYMHKSGFKDLFGFTPRKGSCKQYELTLTEIKELDNAKNQD